MAIQVLQMYDKWYSVMEETGGDPILNSRE